MTEIFKQNPCIGCQHYGMLENVTLYDSEGRSSTNIAFICKNPDLINRVDSGRRIRFFVNDERITNAILIGQVFMNCERGKP